MASAAFEIQIGMVDCIQPSLLTAPDLAEELLHKLFLHVRCSCLGH